jgi:DNA polymerase I
MKLQEDSSQKHKGIVHAYMKIWESVLAYGMSEFKLADTIDIEVSEAQKIIESFFSRVPLVKKFLDRSAAFGKTHKYITTPPPYRRRRWFERSQDFQVLSSIERKSKNTPIQGCNADFTKLAQIYIYEHIRDNNLPVRMLFPVHDEIQTECLEEIAEQWAVTMSNLMVKAAQVCLKTIPMTVDCKVSGHWSK